jgi:hypothetical protein
MFAWVDFAEDDRRKMADVIALLAKRIRATLFGVCSL